MRLLPSSYTLRSLVIHSLAAFGLLALLLQFYQAVWASAPFPDHEMLVVGAVAALSVAYGLARIMAPGPIRRQFHHPDFLIEVRPGDLFDEQDAHLVIGFSDAFDTDDDRVIHHASLQAQFLRREYSDNVTRLNADLDTALADESIAAEASRAAKHYGKLHRYPVGTVAVLGSPSRHFFCLAYSKMTDDLVAQSSSEFIWLSLAHLWETIFRHAQRGRVAMPVIGTGLARINSLDLSGMLKLLLLSYVSASRRAVVTNTLTIVVTPREFNSLDRTELRAFLNAL